jgi:hypothetical protein
LISAIVKKNKKYIIGFIGFLSGTILIIVICVISWITAFFGGSFLRYAGPIMGNNEFIVNEYKYKTIITDAPKEKDYNHTNKVIFDNLIKIEYGFTKYPGITKAKDADGKIIANEGPPFSFFIEFSEFNHDINYIDLDSIELIKNNNTINLLKQCKIGYVINSGWFWEMNKSSIINQIKKENRINILNIRKKIIEYYIKNTYIFEDEKEQLNDEMKIEFSVGFSHVPVDVVDDETITIKFNIIFTMSDGSTQSKQISDIYYREYYNYEYISINPLEKFPYAKDIKE